MRKREAASAADIDEFEQPEEPLNKLRVRARRVSAENQCVEIECTRRFRNERRSRGWEAEQKRKSSRCVRASKD